MKTPKFYQDQAAVTKDLTGYDEAVERGWLNAQWRTEEFERAVAKVIYTIESALREVKLTAADASAEVDRPDFLGGDYRSAPAVAGRIQQRLAEIFFNADLGNLTSSAAACQKAQDAVSG